MTASSWLSSTCGVNFEVDVEYGGDGKCIKDVLGMYLYSKEINPVPNNTCLQSPNEENSSFTLAPSSAPAP